MAWFVHSFTKSPCQASYHLGRESFLEQNWPRQLQGTLTRISKFYEIVTQWVGYEFQDKEAGYIIWEATDDMQEDSQMFHCLVKVKTGSEMGTFLHETKTQAKLIS